MANTPAHKIPIDVSIYESEQVFDIISHTIIKAEQSSWPCGTYISKELLWKVNPNNIYLNQKSGSAQTLTEGNFYYRSTSGNTIVETMIDGDFTHALDGYNGSYLIPTNPIFEEDDTDGYYAFEKVISDLVNLQLKTIDVLAQEEAYIKRPISNSGDLDQTMLKNMSQESGNNIIEDYRYKKLVMYGALGLHKNTPSDDYFRYTFNVLTLGSDGIEYPLFEENMEDMDVVMSEYNLLNIRSK